MTIKQRRLAKGWSQEELARHSGLSSRTIQRIEGGHRAGLESLKCLAAVFNMSISTLMQEQEPQQNTATTSDEIVDSEHYSQPNSSSGPNSKLNPKLESVILLDIEREAIDFAQSLIAEPNDGQADKLSKLERDALRYAKNLLKKFGE